MEHTLLNPKDLADKKRMKSFLKWMVDELGEDEWLQRRRHLVTEIASKESSIDLSKPIEPQLYAPKDDDINWYIFIAELAWDVQHSDSSYSSRRIYPYILAIGQYVDQLRKVPNIEAVLERMLSNNNSPERQIFEILTAAHYIKNGYSVEFIPECSLQTSEGFLKSPDIRATRNGNELFVECKRADKHTNYAITEETCWKSLWEGLSEYMLVAFPWSVAHVTFKCPIEEIAASDLIGLFELCLKTDEKEISSEKLILSISPIDKKNVEDHYSKFSVRPNCPQQEKLIFGYTDSNEKRSLATLAAGIKRGDQGEVLNIFVDEIANCVAAQWRCVSEKSLRKRSKHFKSLIGSAVSQFPREKLGVIHLLYETREGIAVEKLRRVKHLEELPKFDLSGTLVSAILIHAVNYYPTEGDYLWAETVQDFVRAPGFLDYFYDDVLMLGDSSTPSYLDTTHWEQDEASTCEDLCKEKRV